MPEQKPTDHWDTLAADLGTASPTPKDEKKPADAEQDQTVDEVKAEALEVRPEAKKGSPEPSGGRAGSRVVSGFGFQRGPVNWAQLAGELGVEPTAEVAEPAPSSSSSSESSHTEPVEPLGLEEIATEEKPEEVAVVDLPDETSEEGEQAKPSGRRRRRRRRPRKDSGETESDKSEPESAAIQAGEAEPVAIQDGEAESAEAATGEPSANESGAADEGGADEAASAPKRRGRGRGGRRRGRKKKDESADTTSENDKEVASDDRGKADTAEPSQPTADEDKDEDEDKGKSEQDTKKSHRGIPSWQEAISVVTDANLERRTKKTGSTSDRGRGGRRRRGGDNKSVRGK